MAQKQNRYSQIIEHIFRSKFSKGSTRVEFERTDIETAAAKLEIRLPRNLGDLIYSFRYRVDLPDSIRADAPSGMEWIISPCGRARYCFLAVSSAIIAPSPMLVATKVLDATPGIIDRYALNDEQALLAKLRYNRLVDLFTGVVCYSLQSHLRTAVSGMGQVETDEVYVGVDRRGAHYVFPVQAKGGRDKLGIVQIEQDFAMCESKFPKLLCRPVAAQFMEGGVIAIFEFEKTDSGVGVSCEKHYRLVPPSELTEAELETYQRRSD